MAQLVAHLLCKQGVRGSSPLGSTPWRPGRNWCGSVISALASRGLGVRVPLAPPRPGGITMIGKLKTVVLDAADLTGLADFYVALAGWTRTDVEEDWITLGTPDGWRVAVQLAPDHVPPRWPD